MEEEENPFKRLLGQSGYGMVAGAAGLMGGAIITAVFASWRGGDGVVWINLRTVSLLALSLVSVGLWYILYLKQKFILRLQKELKETEDDLESLRRDLWREKFSHDSTKRELTFKKERIAELEAERKAKLVLPDFR